MEKLTKINFQKNSLFLFLFLLFLAINFFFSLFSLRLDFSYNKSQTLSPATKKIIGQLDDLVQIKFFASSDIPVRLLPLKTEIVDLLQEYKKASRGKIKVKILDPKKDEKAKNEAIELGLPELQFSQIEKDKYAVSSSYFGIGVQYGDKREIIPQTVNIETLEYDLTSAIFKLTQKQPVKIGFWQNLTFSADSQRDEFYTFKKVLSQQFDLEFKKEIDKDWKALVIIGDENNKYSTDEAERIKNYLEKDRGKVVFLIDRIIVEEGLNTKKEESPIFSLLEDYGIKIEENFVLSQNAELASFTTGVVSFFTPYPFWLKTNNFLKTSPFFTNIEVLVFPWVSSIEVKEDKKEEISFLVKSSKNSWEQKQSFSLYPNNISLPSKNEMREYNLVVEKRLGNQGRLLVIPCSRFVKEQFLSKQNSNLGFMINILDFYAFEGKLAGIRNRSVFIPSLKELPEATKDWVKYLNVMFLPGLTAIFAVVYLLKRSSA